MSRFALGTPYLYYNTGPQAPFAFHTDAVEISFRSAEFQAPSSVLDVSFRVLAPVYYPWMSHVEYQTVVTDVALLQAVFLYLNLPAQQYQPALPWEGEIRCESLEQASEMLQQGLKRVCMAAEQMEMSKDACKSSGQRQSE